MDRDALADAEDPQVHDSDRADDQAHRDEVQRLAERPDPVVSRDEVADPRRYHEIR